MLLGGVMCRIGPALVVEIVEQPGERPGIFVAAKFSGVGADAGLDSQRVFAKTFALGVLAQQIPRIIAVRHLFSSSIGHIRAAQRIRGRPNRNPQLMTILSAKSYCRKSVFATPVNSGNREAAYREKCQLDERRLIRR